MAATGARPILVVNGPNLNLIGEREPEIYGKISLAEIEESCRTRGQAHGLEVACQQSNHEGEIVTAIQQARHSHAGIIINAGAYSHTSIAILDALRAADLPAVEVHFSNIYRRERFRHKSYVSYAVDAVICGCGALGYEMAVDALAAILQRKREQQDG